MYIFGNGGFTLDGIPAKDLQIVMSKESERPILPSTVDSTMSIAGRNGIIDMGATLGTRQFSLACKVITRDYRTLQKAIEQIASVLVDRLGKPRTVKLVFDVNPDRCYLVRYSGSLGIDRLFGLGQFNLPLLVVDREPFAKSNIGTDELMLDSDLVLESEVRLDDVYDKTFISNGTMTIFNFGTMNVKPQIKLTGSFSSILIKTNSKTLSLSSCSGTVVIDCDKLTIKENDNNVLHKLSGDFISLIPLDNIIEITGTSLNVNVSFIFKPYFY